MISIKNRILFRADGDSKIGLGHIMRCAALSQILKDKFNCIFIVNNCNHDVYLILKQFGEVISLISSDKQDELIKFGNLLQKEDIVVIDGYSFDDTYLSYVQNHINKLVLIDDYAKGYFNADLVINHASDKLKERYRTHNKSKFLCGFNYLILREEFLNAARIQRKISKANTAFICMGGADPTNTTLKVIKSCIQVRFIKNIIVVTGAAYLRQNELKKFIDNNLEINIVSHVNVNASTMINLISSSHICICPSSSIALEVCCVKSGLLTGTTVDNQALIHEQLIEGAYADSIGNFNNAQIRDIALKLKKFKQVSYINEMMYNQSLAIDGKSAERILDEFEKLLEC